MPKRRRLLNPPRKPQKVEPKPYPRVRVDREVRTARGRFMGALLEAYEADDSDDEKYIAQHSSKKDKHLDEDNQERKITPPRQSYVLKLFDRSVDLSQFKEDSPLYPICRAWIANQPKANYSDLGHKYEEPEPAGESVTLPGPEGTPVSRIPTLLPDQQARNKDNINLDYSEAPPPSRSALLSGHIDRWTAVRHAWLEQASRVEARYEETQKVLNKISLQ